MLPTDAIPAAEFLIRHLYRSIDVAEGRRFSAIAESENPGGDNWFWNDDNAKSLEFLSRPEVWRRFPGEIAEVLRFVRSMCRGPYIFRRVRSPRLGASGKVGAASKYLHSLMQLKSDLLRGAVAAGVRFHDERTHDNLWLTGNRIEFTRRRRRLGQLTYTYTIDARSMVIEAEAALDLAPGREVSDVVLTIGHNFEHS